MVGLSPRGEVSMKKISQTIEALHSILKSYGDLPVCIEESDSLGGEYSGLLAGSIVVHEIDGMKVALILIELEGNDD